MRLDALTLIRQGPSWDQVGTRLGSSDKQVLGSMVKASEIRMTFTDKSSSSWHQYQAPPLGRHFWKRSE